MGKAQGTPEWSVTFTQTDRTGIQGRVIGAPIFFDKAEGIYSSEADGVWIRGGKAYKIYGVGGSHDDEVNAKKKKLDDAKEEAVRRVLPIPDMETVFCTLQRSNPDRQSRANVIPDRNIFGVALVSNYVSGTPFSLQVSARSGKNPTMAINGINDINILRRIKNAFKAADRMGLMDPQGTIDVTSGSVMFLDVHYREGSTSVEEIVKTVNDRIKEFQPRPQHDIYVGPQPNLSTDQLAILAKKIIEHTLFEKAIEQVAIQNEANRVLGGVLVDGPGSGELEFRRRMSVALTEIRRQRGPQASERILERLEDFGGRSAGYSSI